MKTFAIISLLVAVAYAQPDSSNANPLIPTGISTGCSSFLNALNTDSSLLSCSSALVKATSAFSAGSNMTDASSSTVNTALNNLCSATSACPEGTLRPKLTSFYAACQPELTTSANAAVIRIYDVLYALYPLSQAVCSKGDDGKYCAIELGKATSSSSSGSSTPSGDSYNVVNLASSDAKLQDVLSTLWTPASSKAMSRRDEETYYPNTTTFREYNILFLLLQPTLPATSLCQSCTRAVLSPYISFESDIPYAVGLANSPMMSGQTALYQAVQNLCGASFLSGSVQAAGGISSGIVKSSGNLGAVVSLKTLGAALATIVLGFYATS